MAVAVKAVAPQGLKPLIVVAPSGTRPRGCPGRALMQNMFLRHAIIDCRDSSKIRAKYIDRFLKFP